MLRILFFFLYTPFIGVSQTINDSIPPSSGLSYKQFIVPATLVVGGTLLRNSSINKDVKSFRDHHFENFDSPIDDYMQYIPFALCIGGKIGGLQTQNGVGQMASNFFVSNLLLSIIVLPLKNNIADDRPDNSTDNSFPSGHTAAAFNCATLNFMEYRDANFWFASSGYLMASVTGFFRILNNRHWLSDITAGAGIGMTTALLTYYFNPIKIGGKKDNRVVFSPTYSDKKAGFVLLYNFK